MHKNRLINLIIVLILVVSLGSSCFSYGDFLAYSETIDGGVVGDPTASTSPTATGTVPKEPTQEEVIDNSKFCLTQTT